MPIEHNIETTETKKKLPIKEMVFLANQANEGKTKVLPGDSWAMHYPQNSAKREERLRELLDGKCNPSEIIKDLKPDAIIYPITEIESHGLNAVASKIKDISLFIDNYDYQRFVEFVQSMKNKDINISEIQQIYESIAKNRIRKNMLDVYSKGGRNKINTAIQLETERSLKKLSSLSTLNRILEVLKLNWIATDLHLIEKEVIDESLIQCSGKERELIDLLKESYGRYISTGSELAYEKLLQVILDNIPNSNTNPEDESKNPTQSESMDELEKELEEYVDDMVNPGEEGDPAIPPDDNDEYITQDVIPDETDANPSETNEQMRINPMYKIRPNGTSTKPLTGYYASGRKSYFDSSRLIWSKKKQLSVYNNQLEGTKRQTISGVIDNGLKAIPIPAHYALDANSLKSSGTTPELYRDQNGCFYIKSSGKCSFSIDFLKENPPFNSQPIPEDTELVHQGKLSDETEDFLNNLHGNTIKKAQLIQKYLLARHFYPGGGDLKVAQALQHKLRMNSDASNYIQNLEQSEYLECYSSNTLFTAILRKAGIPARLVGGHNVSGASNGQAEINQDTGHAWTEIWDGHKWRRIDATPQSKPEDNKNNDATNDNQNENTPAEQADDDGINPPQTQNEQEDENSINDSEENDDILDNLNEASDSDVQQSENEQNQAQQQFDDTEQMKQNIADQIDSSSFTDFDKLREEIENSEIPEEMKDELIDSIDKKEEEEKQELQEKIDQMQEDGFIDEDIATEMKKEVDANNPIGLDMLKRNLEIEGQLHDQYLVYQESVTDNVDKWYKFFLESLPREIEINTDEDSLSRQGTFNRKAAQKVRNQIWGTIKNPRVLNEGVKPKFISSIVVDVSSSMSGEKMRNAQRLLVFLSELFSRISETYGYIKFSIYVFNHDVKEIKRFDQDYNSSERYQYEDETSTVKARLMKIRAGGGTSILPAVKKAANDLNKEKEDCTDYVSAMYFISDGSDGNSRNIRKFLETSEKEGGFGEHIKSALFLGSEFGASDLKNIFGENNTTVEPDFDSLIETFMEQFYENIEEYLRNK